jgi:glycosyltransferase involved in cell wall biosynthesis
MLLWGRPVNEKLPISALVITKNEAKALPACLAALKNFDEVFVIDSHSDDGTQGVANAMGATVVQFAWDGTYPKKKQWALDHAGFRNPWVLLLDADEIVSPALLSQLAGLKLDNADFAAADIPLEYVYMGKVLRAGRHIYKRALLHVESVRFPIIDDLAVSSMWEVEGHYQPLVDGHVVSLNGTLRHLDPDPLYQFFSRHNRYSDWEAFLRLHPEARRTVAASKTRQGKLFDKAPCKPLAVLVYSYVLRGGWRDGRAGWDYAVTLAFYYWQIGLKVRAYAAEPPWRLGTKEK